MLLILVSSITRSTQQQYDKVPLTAAVSICCIHMLFVEHAARTRQSRIDAIPISSRCISHRGSGFLAGVSSSGPSGPPRPPGPPRPSELPRSSGPPRPHGLRVEVAGTSVVIVRCRVCLHIAPSATPHAVREHVTSLAPAVASRNKTRLRAAGVHPRQGHTLHSAANKRWGLCRRIWVQQGNKHKNTLVEALAEREQVLPCIASI